MASANVNLVPSIDAAWEHLHGEIAQVVTIREGCMVKLDGYDAPEAALRAVGLEHYRCHRQTWRSSSGPGSATATVEHAMFLRLCGLLRMTDAWGRP